MISIIIPACNRPYQLRNLLTSILKYNTFNDFEVIIIDDNSDKKNKILLKEILTNEVFSNLKIRSIFLTKRSYPSYCRNLGVKISKGDILYFIDDDCEFNADNLQIISKFYKSEKNRIFVLGGYSTSSKDKNSIFYNDLVNCSLFLFWSKSKAPFFFKFFFWEKMESFILNFTTSSNLVCPKNIFDKVKFNEKYILNEDNVFCKDLIKKNYQILFLKKLRLLHNHKYKNFNELLKRLENLSKYHKKKSFFKRLSFIIFYPLIMALFTRKFCYIFHYAIMSYVWTAPFHLDTK